MVDHILVVGDPHFKTTNTKETDALYKKIEVCIRERKPDQIVILGDVLDRHGLVHLDPLRRAVDFLKMCSSYCFTNVLIGNHDRINNSDFLTDYHPFPFLETREESKIKIYPQPGVYISPKTNFSYLFVPYVPPGRLAEAINSFLPCDQYKAVFVHQEFKGAKMGAIISTDGDEWPDFYPPCIAGHIHDYQEIGDNIYYVGTPMAHAFGDREDKTIAWVTVGPAKEFFSIPLLSGKLQEKPEEALISETDVLFRLERLDLQLPIRKQFTLDSDNIDYNDIKLAEKFIPNEGSTYKVVFVGSTTRNRLVAGSKLVSELKKNGVRITYHTKTKEIIEHPTSPPSGRKSYRESVLERISNSSGMKELFERLKL